MDRPDVRCSDDVVPGRLVLGILAAMVALSILLCAGAWLLLRARERQLRPDGRFYEAALGTPRAVAGVRPGLFEDTPPLPALEEQQRAELEQYRWVDQKRGIARIPIDRAMELLCRRAPVLFEAPEAPSAGSPAAAGMEAPSALPTEEGRHALRRSTDEVLSPKGETRGGAR